MKTLAVFEIDGVLDLSARAAGVAKQALRDPDWEIAFVTARQPSRAQETLAFLVERLKTSKYPKPAPTFWCGRESLASTVTQKIMVFQSLIRQHHSVDRVVCYDRDENALFGYDAFVRGRKHPRSFSFYRVESNGEPTVLSGSAVYIQRGPSEF